MEIFDYIEKKKDIHKKLLEYLENEKNVEEYFQNVVQKINDQKIQNDKQEFKAILRLIIKISNNHKRSPNFFIKIEQIISNFKNDIKQIFSNSEIFDIIKSNKRIILYFIEEGIIIPDESIINVIMPEKFSFSNLKYIKASYPFYFFTEFKRQINQKYTPEKNHELTMMNMKLFDEKRKIGENESHICQLIRDDSIEDFISYVNKTNFSLTTTIESSIFETNSFLLKKDPTLIEYSAFFGSIQIFRYLYLNGVELKPSIWIYAIHGNNPELIHLLEENKIKPQDETYREILKESIKCHHFDITNYIQNNFFQNNQFDEDDEYISSQSIKYSNYTYFPNNLNNKSVFYDLCQYDYFTLVNFLLKNLKFDVNSLVI